MKQAEAQVGKLYTIPDSLVFVRVKSSYGEGDDCRACSRDVALRNPCNLIWEVFKSRTVLVALRPPEPCEPRKRANCKVLVEGHLLRMTGHSWKYMHEVHS